MKFMNDYDLGYARQRFTCSSVPNRLALVFVVDNLREQTDMVSDGWAYWPKPARAAAKAMALIESTTRAANDAQELEDITEEEMLAAVRPVKSFLTKHSHVYSPEQRELILRSTIS